MPMWSSCLKLPGVKVEKDGTIKAQGEKLSRVLVDGKRIFGDDPKLATRTCLRMRLIKYRYTTGKVNKPSLLVLTTEL